MSSKAKQIKTRYEKGYVTDTQLTRYMELGVLTAEVYEKIYNTLNKLYHQCITQCEDGQKTRKKIMIWQVNESMPEYQFVAIFRIHQATLPFGIGLHCCTSI